MSPLKQLVLCRSKFFPFQLLSDWVPRMDSAVPGVQVCREYFCCILRATYLRNRLSSLLLSLLIVFLPQTHSAIGKAVQDPETLTYLFVVCLAFTGHFWTPFLFNVVICLLGSVFQTQKRVWTSLCFVVLPPFC